MIGVSSKRIFEQIGYLLLYIYTGRGCQKNSVVFFTLEYHGNYVALHAHIVKNKPYAFSIDDLWAYFPFKNYTDFILGKYF